jgi:hypothetical protein
MHPEVKKFWEDAGYTVVVDILQDDLWKFYWVVVKNGLQVKFVGISDVHPPGTKDAPCTIYILNAKEYSEEEMLRMIKLKVLL